VDIPEIEGLIISLLAQELGEDPEDLKRDLLEGGDDMPISSITLVEIVAELEAACGVRIPATPENAYSFSSVHRLAEMLYRLVEQQREETARLAGEGA
jgi:acyl carrier protein